MYQLRSEIHLLLRLFWIGLNYRIYMTSTWASSNPYREFMLKDPILRNISHCRKIWVSFCIKEFAPSSWIVYDPLRGWSGSHKRKKSAYVTWQLTQFFDSVYLDNDKITMIYIPYHSVILQAYNISFQNVRYLIQIWVVFEDFLIKNS